jgi:hypothetical protein
MAGVLAAMLPLRLALSDAWRQASPAGSGPGTEHTERGPCAGATRDHQREVFCVKLGSGALVRRLSLHS